MLLQCIGRPCGSSRMAGGDACFVSPTRPVSDTYVLMRMRRGPDPGTEYIIQEALRVPSWNGGDKQEACLH